MQGRVGSWLRQRHQEEPIVALLNTGDVYTLRYFLVYMRVHNMHCILLLSYAMSIAVMLLLLMFFNASNATFNTFCCTRKYIIVLLKACNASHPHSQCLLLHPTQRRTHPLLLPDLPFRTHDSRYRAKSAIFFTAEK